MSGDTGIRTNADWLAELRRPAGSTTAVEELQAYLRGSLARALRDRAGAVEADLDDFTQEALVRILESLDRFRGESRFTTWATAVALRVAFTALRRRRYRTEDLQQLEQGTARPADGRAAPEPGATADRGPLLETLRLAIEEQLTDRQRSAVLAELDGVPCTVVVERLQTNANALYKLHHDARKKLRQALNQAGYSDEDVRQELQGAFEES